MAPALREDETAFGGNVVALEVFGGGPDFVSQKHTAAISMQLEFFNSLSQPPKMAEQFVFLLARQEKRMHAGVNEESVAQRSHDDEEAHDQQNLPGQPAKVSRPTEQDGHVHRHDWQAEQSLGDVKNIIGKGNHHFGSADVFELTKGHPQNFAYQILPQFGNGPLSEAGQH